MEILGNFGINPILLSAQIVNFLVIFFLLKRFALKPILQMLKDREKTIKDGLQQAEEAKILLEQAGEKERALLKKAQTEAKILLQEARQERDDILSKSEEKTRVQTEKMLAEAREQIILETQAVEKKLTAQVNELAIQLLQKSADNLFSKQDQKSVIDKAIKQLEKKIN